MKPKSIIILGGGPGGYAAAWEASQRGLLVHLVERQEIGGTCLNRGCIPSKFFLSKAKAYASLPGLPTPSGAVSAFPAMAALLERKNAIVSTLRQRMDQALKGPAIKKWAGIGRLVSPHQIEITLNTGERQVLEADIILLATGSAPVRPALFPEHPAIIDSTGILDLSYIPSHLVVVGAGYIGCELACAFQGLGSKVTIIEKESRLLPTQEEMEATAALLQRSFEKRGMTLWLGTQVESVEGLDSQRLRLRCSNGQTLEANTLLLAIGRRPRLEEITPERAGLQLTQGRLTVDAQMRTAVPSIYAVGDLVSPLPLAHVAAREAEVAVAAMFGETRKIDYAAIPRCVYTWPEAAAVGLSESQARQAGYQPRVDRYHFAASAKAMIEEESEGLWLLVSDQASGKILGSQIVGPHATELVHLVSLSLKAGFSIEDIAQTVFAHPSLSEAFSEVARRAQTSRTKNLERR